MDDTTLAAAFPAATEAQWRALVDGVLKGADFEKRLVRRTPDGIKVAPLYPPAEAAPQPGRAEPGRWRVSQRVDHPDPAEASALALTDLDGGADALTLVMAGSPAARGFGLPGPQALDAALSGVMLPLIGLRLDAGAVGPDAARALLALATSRGDDLAALDIDLGLDPVAIEAATGAAPSWPALPEILRDLDAAGFAGRAFLADARPFHEAGAGEALELAALLSGALATLRALEAGGYTLERARDALAFLLVADSDEFLTVAKTRALRRLWARVEEACGLAPAPIRLHAETAWRSTTRRDPWVNLLRATTAAFSAGLGGADAITVLPFTAALGLPDAFARRCARNTQHVLLDEANLWRVADPAAGAGGFETLTEALCTEAWAQFQAIERDGGIAANLRSGALATRLAGLRKTRDADLATRRQPITGTSEFPDLHEAPVAVLAPAPAAGPVPEGALPSRRLAEPYEALRDASDAALARTGRRPRVFLANLGPLSAFNTRATFARNAFEAGGIEAVTNEGFADHAAMAEAFRQSGTRVACLCSSDAIYAEQAVAAAEALRAVGAATVYLAGKPGELEAALRAAGVAHDLYAGCDLVKLLAQAQEAA
ncbi:MULTISPECIES: methylmalonyl-CoA mutase family protein [Methylobacterium]|jgi:methylmalonyl-CoA mutase|uniref:methylmalonyl-CoA mutase family protein n=2 Tax=Methylobacteriaceae TaxID=119045 RepID=UPI0008E221FF|nr:MULTISPECIES: methylmalonyl-CoA mutase family protein [Methylobacterium]MBK3399829.1 methylmalonyl-CoA mutase [Methylobacterium ajmalii]MBK3407165.1 methylmalonyl-CoA mutase [Methylobacterium ajmalii]MBZ6416640.1 methylmalonyl-CoA mutase family protein [Methylobacterium sp.]SFF20216.1 methylmalonyl-CoA mutase [Methylobacterium sp. yr596]